MYSSSRPSSLLSGKPGSPGLRPLWASVREPRVLAPSHCGSWATLTMAPFRLEPAHWMGQGLGFRHCGRGWQGRGKWWWQPSNTAQPDVGVATPQLGPRSLGSLAPSKVSVGADRGKDYSWVLAHARAGICRPLARNDVGLVLSNPAVTAEASAPLLLGSWAGTCAPCNHLCPLNPSSCSALDESPHWPSADFTSGSRLPPSPPISFFACASGQVKRVGA